MGQPGHLPTKDELINVNDLLAAYYDLKPDINNPSQKVAFGTSGHRGAAEKSSFNEAHIIAIVTAIVEYRKSQDHQGPLFVGFDSHLLSIAAFKTAVEVLEMAGVDYRIDTNITPELIDAAEKGETPQGSSIWTPTPAISRAIIKTGNKSDGIVITPSHNPPTDGGIKYNPPHGGPADTDVTKIIETRANEIIAEGVETIKRANFDEALVKAVRYDFRKEYVADLASVIDMEAIRKKGVRIGIDPMGGASVDYWSEIAKQYDLNLTVINPNTDPTFKFVTLDWDGKIRMDCSSPYAMAGFLNDAGKGEYDFLAGNDCDADRHGIATPSEDGYKLMNPNHYLATAISYLFGGARQDWDGAVKVGKTLVSSSLIDRVTAGLKRDLYEVPVGFKWFVEGLTEGWLGFGGEESAGASFLDIAGKVWTTDKDGIILCLLAAEIIAKTGKNPAELHADLINKYGESWYERIDAPATLEEKAALGKLSPEQVVTETLAGDKITGKLTKAPGNDSSIGGLKVTTENAWFAARPSGTENVYKIYAESFISEDHLKEVQGEAREIVNKAISAD